MFHLNFTKVLNILLELGSVISSNRKRSCNYFMVSIHSHIFIKQGSMLVFVVYQNKYVKTKEKPNLKMFMENLLCAYNIFLLIIKFT